mmetsp:Transcript_36362/g.71552  ORF Transcript_36362/g.71552 Transcript_36362/m.71552 type:complete len:360 (+) Transcript_36362:1030-2109(+)
MVVTNFAHLHEAASCPDVAFLYFVRTADNRGPNSAGNPVVVRFTEATEGGYSCSLEVVLGEITHPLLGDDYMWFERDNLRAHIFDIFFLHTQHGIPIFLSRYFDVDLTLTLLILQGAVKQQHPRVLYTARHLRVRYVLVKHDPGDDTAVVDLSPRNFLNLGISFDVHLTTSLNLARHYRDAGDSHINHSVVPARRELSPKAARHELCHSRPVLHVHHFRHRLALLQRTLEGHPVTPDDDGGMYVVPYMSFRQFHDLPRQNYDGCGPVPHLLVLGARQLDHRLGTGVRNVHLSENAVAIVRQHYAAHGVKEHFEHGAGAEGGADDVGNGVSGGDIIELGTTTSLAFSIGVQYHHLSGCGS